MPGIIQFRQSAKTVSLQETVEEPDIYHTLSSLTHCLTKLKEAIDALGSIDIVAGTTIPTCEQSTLDSGIDL